ncbi:MAG: ZIP family metal transporter [Kiritimatiellia bacterium]|nr:ZIP family metal transporter [Kiritimatiellia bacterium]
MNLLIILFFCTLGSLGSVGLAAAILLVPPRFTDRIVPVLVAYATGALLGAAFLGMIPQALSHLPAADLMPVILAGLLAFFLLEKILLWRHCHDGECPLHGSSGLLILFGDAFHNFVDGVVIAAAFLISPSLGIAAAFAVIAHEIPQELGDFMILLQSGYTRSRALLLNALSGSTTLLGGLIAFFFLQKVNTALPYVMAISAASFIYIALADLIPGHRRNVSPASTILQLTLMLLGIGTIALFRAHAH